MLSRGISSAAQPLLSGVSVSPPMFAIHRSQAPVASSSSHTPHACASESSTRRLMNMRKNPRRSGWVTSRSIASCTASLWIEAMHSARWRSSRRSARAAVSRAISAAGASSSRSAAGSGGPADGDMAPSMPDSRAPRIVLLADEAVRLMDQWAVRRTGDLPIGYLPDCEGPSLRVILSAMFTQLFKLSGAGVVMASISFAAACTRVQTAAPPSLPEVTAAPAVARQVTEWDEFTGRLEPVQSEGVRPRVSGLISTVTFEEGSLVRQGQLLFQLDDRPFLTQVQRLRAELTQATSARDRAASEMRRADRLATDNAMSLEERERRAGAAAEAAPPPVAHRPPPPAGPRTPPAPPPAAA